MNLSGKILIIIILSLTIFTISSEQVIISVKEAQIKSSPSSFSSVIAIANKNNKFELIETVNSWIKIKTADGKTGYLNKSAVEERTKLTSYKGEITLYSSVTTAAAKAKITGATYSFDDEIFYMYSNSNKDINFNGLNKYTRQINKTLSDSELEKFRKNGKLGEFK